MLELFKQFLANQENTHEPFYVTGPAGSGKTHSLAELTNHLLTLDTTFVVCAFTHDACKVLRGKLNPSVQVKTLHSVLRKRPTINDTAVKSQHIERSRQHSLPDVYDIIIVDEAYMVCDEDISDINFTCEDEEGETRTKVVYVGDMNQLPPIAGPIALNPNGKWWYKLTKIWRTAEDNKLLDVLCDLVSYIEGTAKPKPLLANENFIRGIDLVEQYNAIDSPILLAYTNQRVEELNAMVQGYHQPFAEDEVFSPTTRQLYTMMNPTLTRDGIYTIKKAFGDDYLYLDSKYRTLEHLLTMPNIQYMDVADDKDDICTYAVIFGHYQYKQYIEALKTEAAAANKACTELTEDNVRMWCQVNRDHPAAKRRARAWRNYLTFKECVICLDFNHAKTVHKSQGSTYENVLIDTQDLHICAQRDFNLYLRLLYVAISRSSSMVYTN